MSGAHRRSQADDSRQFTLGLGLRTGDLPRLQGVSKTPSTTRRAVLGAAWAVPVLAVATAAPNAAASATLTVAIDGSFGGGGYTFNLRDGKFGNLAQNPSLSNTSAITVPFVVTDGSGNALEGATVEIVGDNSQDGQGNYMFGASNASATGNFTQSPVKRTSSQVTDASGRVVVKISTSTFSRDSCAGGIPRPGTVTATVSKPGYTTITVTYTYLIYDAGQIVVCP